ncbi:MAG: stage II sporulation protein R [Eubacteriales bacterium]|nr:stage II sporulation protein R [Eubacteriales bacterium]
MNLFHKSTSFSGHGALVLNRTASVHTRLALCLTFLLLGILLLSGQERSRQEALAAGLAPSVLRFHILADSNSDADQQVKLEIRSLILDYMRQHLSSDASKADTVRWVDTHRAALTNLADTYLKKKGFSYSSRLQIANDYFPTRVYGDLVFPCGNYDAVRITLGCGRGHNWWCVLYPQFCFVDEACEKNSNQDDRLLPEDHRPELKIRLKLLSWLKPQ